MYSETMTVVFGSRTWAVWAAYVIICESSWR